MATLKDYYNKTQKIILTDLYTHNIDNIVETGTGLGDSIQYLLDFNINTKNIYSFEIHNEVWLRAVNRFNGNSNVDIKNIDSYNGLKELLPNLTGNTMFFLDAHYPGADFGYNSYTDTTDEKLNLPLKSEIELICRNRDISNDIFLIDDLRIYETGSFEFGNISVSQGASHTGIDFIMNFLGETHIIQKHYFYTGFITAYPKK